MRPAWLSPLLPLLLLAAFAWEWMRGTPHDVRDAWMPWVPALLAFAGVLGPALLAQRKLAAPTARALVAASLLALGALLVLVALAPRGPAESGEAISFAAADALASGALVALAALGVRPALAVATWLVAALLLARGVGLVASAAGVGAAPAGVLSAALLWTGAAMLASALAARRFRARRRSTPAGTTREARPRS